MRDLTSDEAKAIKSLKRLARSWPQSLKLFSWSGALCVMDADMDTGADAILADIMGIPNDGGDPA